jgi:Putative MetA-pathway of phenol degradation
MACVGVRRLAWAFILVLGHSALGHAAEVPASEGAGDAGASPPTSAAPGEEEAGASDSQTPTVPTERSVQDRILAALSQEEDADGPISTDRPTFTPANTVVPRGRLQFESGFTFNNEPSSPTRTTLYDLPELAMRYGIFNRVELRTFWLGQTWTQTQLRPVGPWRQGGGLSDMEVGFKWQLLTHDKERKWIPTTGLITSIYAPTGGSSVLGSHTVEPYVNLIYGWPLTDKLTLAGSTGYLGMRVTDLGRGRPADSFQRYHQSLVAFLSMNKRTTLFYEWYVLMFTNAVDNRPTHFMDGGILYLLTPNMQLDLRAGFGLSGRPDDFFTGAGYSVRF